MKFAVVGSPVSHSLSPELHRAAFAALGLPHTYDRVEIGAGALGGFVRGLGPAWHGLSVTMPGKLEALELATDRTPRSVAVNSANTLVRTEQGWFADCTDIDGAAGLLNHCGAAGTSAIVVGAGGTARPVLAALADRGFTDVSIVARSVDRATGAMQTGTALGLRMQWLPLVSTALPAADVVVSTMPGAAQSADIALIDALAAAAPAIADVAYSPWPTPLIAAAERTGARTAGGLTMLLHQAIVQSELFTGLSAPRAEMAAALAGAAPR